MMAFMMTSISCIISSVCSVSLFCAGTGPLGTSGGGPKLIGRSGRAANISPATSGFEPACRLNRSLWFSGARSVSGVELRMGEIDRLKINAPGSLTWWRSVRRRSAQAKRFDVWAAKQRRYRIIASSVDQTDVWLKVIFRRALWSFPAIPAQCWLA